MKDCCKVNSLLEAIDSFNQTVEIMKNMFGITTIEAEELVKKGFQKGSDANHKLFFELIDSIKSHSKRYMEVAEYAAKGFAESVEKASKIKGE